MIGRLLALGVVVVGAIGVFAAGVSWRGRRFAIIPPSERVKPDQPHRQAIHHFASGVLPPWR
jgi:hypothetical protein